VKTGPAHKEDPLKDYVHAHDGDEEATFFTQSIRSKLKAAVTIMWDAELYLRLYQPEKSLPYQYKALKLLKEISQESRIYVHRTGFDPPPLKEEKRLSADLSEIKNSISKSLTENKSFPNSRAAITLIEELLSSDSATISEESKNILSKAGQELASLELQQPGHYLKTLSGIKRVTQNEVNPAERRLALMNIRSTLWKTLPQEVPAPQGGYSLMHELDIEFLKSLDAGQRNK